MVIRNIHKIDASTKTLGRIACEIALLLRGKHKIEFEPSLDVGDIVEVTNYANIKVTGKKMDQKIYYHHSGYPGGMKEANLKKKMETDPQFALRNAVLHMLPTNKLRAKQIKRLKFVESK